jgi:hypothetical protein
VSETDAHATCLDLESPRLLFLPRCGETGIGEYVRCLTLAQALRARHEKAEIHFVVTPSLPRLAGDDFPRVELPRDGAQGEALDAILARLRPHCLVTNNRGRQRELERARARGAAVVAIFSTERRSRARRLDVLRSVDQIWVVPGEGRDGARLPSRVARWIAGSPHCEVVETLHPPVDPTRAAKRRAALGLEGERYALFAPGGGGWSIDGRLAADVFADAAARAARAGTRSVLVAGPLHRGTREPQPGVLTLAEVEPEAMVDLASEAEIVVCAGGGLLGWAQALGRPCVATPMPCGDQRQRTAACRAQGTALVVGSTADALAEGAQLLLGDAERRRALRERLAAVGPRNALARCVALLEPLLRQRAATS